MGTLIVSNGSSGGGINPAPIAGGIQISPGIEINFSSQTPVAEGYLVQGDIGIDPTGQPVFNVTQVLDSNPTIVNGSLGGNVTIGPNKSYLVKNTGSIGGNVSVNGGALLVIGGSASGNISLGPDSAIICKSGATVSGGSFKVTGGGTDSIIVITDSTVNGAFSTQGVLYIALNNNQHGGLVKSSTDGYVTIKGNTINNNLQVSSVTNACSITGNTVSGSTTLDPACAN